MTEPRGWDTRVKEMIGTGLYSGGCGDPAQTSRDELGLHAKVARAAVANGYLQGETTWRHKKEMTVTQSAYQKVNDSNTVVSSLCLT